jgi:hypothetical protein
MTERFAGVEEQGERESSMRLANALHGVRDDEACAQMVWIFQRYAQAAFRLGPRRQGGRYCPSYTDILVGLIRVS